MANGAGDTAEIEALLEGVRCGRADATDRLFALLYEDFRSQAHLLLRVGPRQTLCTTELVNETWLRLSGRTLSVESRRHFFNLAARAMRQTVIDQARERFAGKRGGDLIRTDLDENVPDHADAQAALALDQALGALENQDGELAEIFVWRLFGGLSTQEIADLRGVHERTIQRDLGLARNYLRLALEGAA